MLSDNTPGLATAGGVVPPLKRSIAMLAILVRTTYGIRKAAPLPPGAAVVDAQATNAAAAAFDNSGTGARARPAPPAGTTPRPGPDESAAKGPPRPLRDRRSTSAANTMRRQDAPSARPLPQRRSARPARPGTGAPAAQAHREASRAVAAMKGWPGRAQEAGTRLPEQERAQRGRCRAPSTRWRRTRCPAGGPQ